jgi:serine/threonine protein kinase
LSKLEFTRGEVIADKYEVVDFLDESPLGLLYRTKHIKTGKYVRLVLLRPKLAGRDQKDQMVEVFKKAKQLSHPHLVKLGELGEHEGVAYYTFEDFDGGTLRELLQEYRVGGKQFALKEAAQIAMQILEGLGELHRHGLVLRALRPEYVLVNTRHTGPRKQTFVAQTKIIGAGFWDLVPSAGLAEDEFTRGEAQYLAPELKSFEPVASPRCDVYSAGVLFYEMLVGTAPIGTFQPPKVRRPDLPEHVNTVIELALAQSPEDRYQTSQDFVNDIQRTFQDGALGDAPPLRPIVTPIGWLLALSLVAFLGVILFNFRPDPDAEAELADAALRKEVFDEIQARNPSSDEFKSIYERHPPNMIYIPPGPYVAGRLRLDPLGATSEPLAEKRTTEGYLIDMFEYPNSRGAMPMFGTPYADAKELCRQAGKRLCTADEWERACKGPRSTIFSYGDTFDEDFCGLGLGDPYASGTKEYCKSEWGVFDLSGNFREWTSSLRRNRPLVKGGLKGAPDRGTRCAMGADESMGFTDKSISFRCCRDVDAAAASPQPP